MEQSDRSNSNGNRTEYPRSRGSSVEAMSDGKAQRHQAEKQRHHGIDDLEGEDDYDVQKDLLEFNKRINNHRKDRKRQNGDEPEGDDAFHGQNELYDFSRFQPAEVVAKKLSSTVKDSSAEMNSYFQMCNKYECRAKIPEDILAYAALEGSKRYERILNDASKGIVNSKNFELPEDDKLLSRSREKLKRYQDQRTFENTTLPNASGINSRSETDKRDTRRIFESDKSNDKTRVKSEHSKSALPAHPTSNGRSGFRDLTDRMESRLFINWVEEWKSRVVKQSIRNNEIRQTGMTTIPDQGIGFDQEGLPYELNNPPPHVCDRSDPPLKDERSEPTLKGG